MLVFWSYDAMTDILTLKINASTIGWIGFGFALFAPNGMQDYDIILAGYKDSAGYIYVSFYICYFHFNSYRCVIWFHENPVLGQDHIHFVSTLLIRGCF